MIKKRVGALLLVAALMTSVTSVPAFAQVKDDINSDAVVETVSEDETAEKDEAEEATDDEEDKDQEELKEEELPPLTPDGNLNLVDDITSADGGKQFITVATKSENYFYILIDRDDEGNQTVHFLNLVDESDLLALMDEEQVADYQAAVEAGMQEAQTEIETTVTEKETEPESEPVIEEETEKKSAINVLSAVALLMVFVAAGGGYFYLQTKKKKKEAERPDPDADYTDEDEEVDEEVDLPAEEENFYDEELENSEDDE